MVEDSGTYCKRVLCDTRRIFQGRTTKKKKLHSYCENTAKKLETGLLKQIQQHSKHNNVPRRGHLPTTTAQESCTAALGSNRIDATEISPSFPPPLALGLFSAISSFYGNFFSAPSPLLMLTVSAVVPRLFSTTGSSPSSLLLLLLPASDGRLLLL